jgi:hypothetical protein
MDSEALRASEYKRIATTKPEGLDRRSLRVSPTDSFLLKQPRLIKLNLLLAQQFYILLFEILARVMRLLILHIPNQIFAGFS